MKNLWQRITDTANDAAQNGAIGAILLTIVVIVWLIVGGR